MGNACCGKEEDSSGGEAALLIPEGDVSSREPHPSNFPVFVAYFHGLPRDHAGIFVETETEGDRSGQLFHVKGDITKGMTYESRRQRDLEESTTFAGKVRVGLIRRKCLTPWSGKQSSVLHCGNSTISSLAQVQTRMSLLVNECQ